MLVICEDCAKKYNIDESKIRGNRARFTCNECGHIIIVDKSDLSRPLVRAASTNQQPSSSIDLLKEMEAPLSQESGPQPAASEIKPPDAEPKPDAVPAKEKKKEISIPIFFLIGGSIAFILVNGGTGYVLLQHHATVTALPATLLVLLCTWAVSLGVLFGIGLYLSRSVNNMASSVHRISQGEKDVNFSAKGPKELANLGRLLANLSIRIK